MFKKAKLKVLKYNVNQKMTRSKSRMSMSKSVLPKEIQTFLEKDKDLY
mgnify:CR=1 FL=1